jgi:hypothetical protein
MQVIREAELPWKPIAVQRESGKEAKVLLTGVEGARDNYTLVIVREGVVATTPRHRHNFDQLRMTISGRTNYGPRRWIEPGELAYFPEGVHYGPEECEGNRVGFTLQFGGATGNGMITQRQIRVGREELSKSGRFEKGIYYPTDPAPGVRKAQDGYEAIWEYTNGRPLVYPAPRYDEPVLIRPQNFDWIEDPSQPNVATKVLGLFTERRLELMEQRLERGAMTLVGPRGGIILGMVLSGTGSIDAIPLEPLSAFEVSAHDVGHVTASEDLTLLLVGLPIFT